VVEIFDSVVGLDAGVPGRALFLASLYFFAHFGGVEGWHAPPISLIRLMVVHTLL
jgi:hypothetical protein